MKLLMTISTVFLCLVTLASTVLFWSSMPTDQLGKMLAGITAMALEACKYSFFPAGVYYLKKHNAGGAGLLLMGVVLVGISVAATTGFLENAYNQQTQTQQQNSLEYKTKTQQLNSLQQQIDTLNGLIAADAQGSYRTRALQTAKEVKQLEAQRDTALTEIKDYRQTAQGNAQSLFAVLATPLAASADQVRQGAFMGLAIIVDICAIAALLAVTGMSTKQQQLSSQTTSETHAPKKETTVKARGIKAAGSKQPQAEELTPHEQEIAQQIVAGIYGQPPIMRNIIATTKTNHTKVQNIMLHLVANGKLRRDGKQYHLTQPALI